MMLGSQCFRSIEDIDDGTFVLDKMFAVYFILLVPRRRAVVFDSSPNNDV